MNLEKNQKVKEQLDMKLAKWMIWYCAISLGLGIGTFYISVGLHQNIDLAIGEALCVAFGLTLLLTWFERGCEHDARIDEMRASRSSSSEKSADKVERCPNCKAVLPQTRRNEEHA